MSIPWEEAVVTDLSATVLNSLAAGASSGLLEEVDNTVAGGGGYTHGLLDLSLGAALTCATGSPKVDCFMAYAPDGSGYPNPPSGTGAIPDNLWVGSIPGISGASFTRNHSGLFPLLPFKLKIALIHKLHGSTAWSGTAVLKLYRCRLDVA